MAARKGAPEAEAATPQAASSEGPTPEPADGPEGAPVAAPAPPPAPPQPIRRYVAPKPTPIRAGGHVLTERGWEIDTGQES